MNALKTDLIVPSHIGSWLTERPPSLVLFAYIKVKGKPYVLARSPSADPKHAQDFLHVLARGAFPNDLSADKSKVNLSAISRNLLHYYAGFTETNFPDAGPLEILHREATPLFSGPKENQEIIVACQNLGTFEALPPIVKPSQGGVYPEAIKDNPAALKQCETYRSKVAWLDFEKAMQNLTQKGNIRAPSYVREPGLTAFHVQGLTLQDGAHFTQNPKISMPMQGSMVYAFQLFGKYIGASTGTPPNGRDKWITDAMLANYLCVMGSPYNTDPRVPQHCAKGPTSDHIIG
ncbi:MAG: hypothetical protein AB7E52_04215 [Bdellovibrionales bacterium]